MKSFIKELVYFGLVCLLVGNLGYKMGRNAGIHEAFQAFKQVLEEVERDAKFTDI